VPVLSRDQVHTTSAACSSKRTYTITQALLLDFEQLVALIYSPCVSLMLNSLGLVVRVQGSALSVQSFPHF